MSFIVVASKVCVVVAAALGVLAAVLKFLDVHLGADRATLARDRLNGLYATLHESPFARVPRALFQFVARFHGRDPRGLLGRVLRRWWGWASLAMLLVADVLLAVMYPGDLLEAYRKARSSIVEAMPGGLFDEDVAFVIGLIGSAAALVAISKAMTAINRIGARQPFGERSDFDDERARGWQQVLLEYAAYAVVLTLVILMSFGIGVAVRRFPELPVALAIVVSLCSFPFLFVSLSYLAMSLAVLVEGAVKAVLLCLYWVKPVRRRFGQFLDSDHPSLDFLFERFEYAVLFVLGVSLSMTLTTAGLALGQALHPELVAPRSWQLLAANALCDGLTMPLTFRLVRWAVAPGGLLWRVPLAVLLNLGVAAMLAGVSLYAGLLGTPQELPPAAVVNVLLGLAPAGDALQFGPYFWVMHTTFLPIAGYLLTLLIFWLVKIALDPAEWVVRQAALRDTPLNYLVAAAGIYVAAFAGLGVVLDQIGRAIEALSA